MEKQIIDPNQVFVYGYEQAIKGMSQIPNSTIQEISTALKGVKFPYDYIKA